MDEEATIWQYWAPIIRPFGLQVFKSQRRNVAVRRPVLTGISGRKGATPRSQ